MPPQHVPTQLFIKKGPVELVSGAGGEVTDANGVFEGLFFDLPSVYDIVFNATFDNFTAAVTMDNLLVTGSEHTGATPFNTASVPKQ